MPEGAGKNPYISKEDEQRRLGQKKWPASVILAAPFFLLVLPLYKAARERVDWRAAAAMIATFELLMFCAEAFSVSRGHWVWNPNRILGPVIFNIPIEEPLLYYWFPPLFVVILMHALESFFEKRKGGAA
ncbi:MAG: lycopene cyclase domain-containing protein [Elusimicrobiales bacterium]|jgi:lycopene cyclase domain-containing protein